MQSCLVTFRFVLPFISRNGLERLFIKSEPFDVPAPYGWLLSLGVHRQQSHNLNNFYQHKMDFEKTFASTLYRPCLYSLQFLPIE